MARFRIRMLLVTAGLLGGAPAAAQDVCPAGGDVPFLSPWALLGLASVIGAAGIVVMKRRARFARPPVPMVLSRTGEISLGMASESIVRPAGLGKLWLVLGAIGVILAMAIATSGLENANAAGETDSCTIPATGVNSGWVDCGGGLDCWAPKTNFVMYIKGVVGNAPGTAASWEGKIECPTGTVKLTCPASNTFGHCFVNATKTIPTDATGVGRANVTLSPSFSEQWEAEFRSARCGIL